MKYGTQTERKSIAIGTCVTVFGLKNLKFNGKVGVMKSPLEPSSRKDDTLHSLLTKILGTL